MNDSIRPARETGLAIEENVALAPLTTLKVGGAARFFVEAKTEPEAIWAVKWAKHNNLPLFVLGGGSNVLISDAGFDGLVLKIGLRGIEFSRNETDFYVTAQAGEDWDEFVRLCVEENLAGVECLSGIPGTIGGTPVQNVGAYGQEISETVASVRVFNRETEIVSELTNAECGFAYRTSVFNTVQKNKFIVLAVAFRLSPGGEPKIAYRDLRQFFGEHNPSLTETRAAVLEIRRAKSMVIDENDANSRSAGSFFKNPIMSKEKFADIKQKAEKDGVENVPHFPAGEENVKIPAAWLIEHAGFYKGYRR